MEPCCAHTLQREQNRSVLSTSNKGKSGLLFPPVMAIEDEEHPHSPPSCLVVGSYCHDVLFRDNRILAASLGGAASFVSNILDPMLTATLHYVSKVGPDFAYPAPHPPILSPSPTTLFHAHFTNNSIIPDNDRILKRITACDPILPSDLPPSATPHPFGLAVAVAGEIPPDTLSLMLDTCTYLFVDSQALIRTFDADTGAVTLVPLRDTGYWELIPRVAFLKASAVEAEFVGVEEVRQWCCVVVTEGEGGCTVYWRDGEVRVPAFVAEEVDPTGAGDSFLAGFAVGLIRGLNVYDAALLGNFFGSITVGQIGVPKLNRRLIQAVRRELERVTTRRNGLNGRNLTTDFWRSKKHEDFHACLIEAAKLAVEQDDDDKGKV